MKIKIITTVAIIIALFAFGFFVFRNNDEPIRNGSDLDETGLSDEGIKTDENTNGADTTIETDRMSVIDRFCGGDCKSYSASYVVREDGVWYEEIAGYGSSDIFEKLPDANIESFEVVEWPLMSDGEFLYVGSEKLDIDIGTYTIDHNYIYDSQKAYRFWTTGNLIGSRDLSENVASDFDAVSFEVFDEYFSRDKNAVYIFGIFSGGYFASGQNDTYALGDPPGLDLDTFEFFGGCSYAKDKDTVWSAHLDWPPKIVELSQANPDTFVVDGPKDDYRKYEYAWKTNPKCFAHDDKNVYWGDVILGAVE